MFRAASASKKRDVLGFRRRARVGQRVEARGVDLGEEIAAAAAAATTVSRDRSPRSTANDLGDSSRNTRSARRSVAGSTGAATQPSRWRSACSKSAGLMRSERRVERASRASRAAEDLHLSLLDVRRRMEPHLAAAEQHQSGDALIGVDDEHRAVGAASSSRSSGASVRLRASNCLVGSSDSR